jgi:hypothetical protein
LHSVGLGGSGGSVCGGLEPDARSGARAEQVQDSRSGGNIRVSLSGISVCGRVCLSVKYV